MTFELFDEPHWGVSEKCFYILSLFSKNRADATEAAQISPIDI
jgi:hypothetical protein